MASIHRFAQSAGRQEGIVAPQTVVVCEQDIQTRTYIAMLIGIVEQNNLWRLWQLKQLVNTAATVSVNSYM